MKQGGVSWLAGAGCPLPPSHWGGGAGSGHGGVLVGTWVLLYGSFSVCNLCDKQTRAYGNHHAPAGQKIICGTW